MKPSTKRLTSAFIALALFIAAFVVFFDMVQPAYGTLMAARGQLVSEQQTLQNESSTISQIESVMAKYASQPAAQAEVNEALPVGADMANAVTQVYGLAQVNNLNVQNIGISLSSNANGQMVAFGDAATAGLLARPTGTIAFNITANGTYENFLNFLSGLQSNLRIFDVRQVSIQNATTLGSKGGVQDMFNYAVTVDTYYQIP